MISRLTAAATLALALAGCTPDSALAPDSQLRSLPPEARFSHLGAAWTARAAMPTPRMGVASAMVNGIIYVIGGITTPNTCSFSSIVEAYDPATNTWSTRKPMPTARINAAAAVVNGRIYVVGGDSNCGPVTGAVEEYDPATDTWTSKAPIPTPRAFHSLNQGGGRLVAVGGRVGSPSYGALASAEEYNPLTDTWRALSPMPETRAAHTAEVVAGKLYVIGGWLAQDTLVLVYTPGTNSWSAGSRAPRNYHFTGSAVINGRIHVVGGNPGGEHASLDPATGAWHVETALSTARSAHAVEVVGAQLFALGGYNAPTQTITSSVESWSSTTPPPLPPRNPRTKEECKNGGWGTFGFDNQGQCVRYVETGSDSRKWRVCAGESSTTGFSNLSEAVAAAPAGATIWICDGVHEGSAIISKPLTIRAENPGGATLRDPLDWPARDPRTGGQSAVITVRAIQAGTVRIQDLKFLLRQTAVVTRGSWNQIELLNIDVTSTDSAHSNAIVAHHGGDGSVLLLQGSRITGVARAVWAFGGSIDVAGSSFDRTGQGVIFDALASSPLVGARGIVTNSTFGTCDHLGCVRISSRGGVEVVGNTFTSSTSTPNGRAINVSPSQAHTGISQLPVFIRDNTITGPAPGTDPDEGAGVYVLTYFPGVPASSVEISGNRISNVGVAIGLNSTNETVVTARDNVIQGAYQAARHNWAHPAESGGAPTRGTLTFQRNDVLSTTQAFGAKVGHGAIDLTCNWWGSTAGPISADWDGSASAFSPWALEPIAGRVSVNCP